MTILVDIIILAVIALCVIIGYIKGLTGVLLTIISFVLSIIIATVLVVPVSNIVINNTQIDETITETVKNMIMGEDDTEQTEETMPTTITEYISEKVESVADEARETVAETTANEVAVGIIRTATWIVLFLVAKILLILLKFVTSIIAKLPVIKQFDKAGGVVYGLVKGLIIVYIALAIISFVSPLMSGKVASLIDESFLGSAMYNNNILLKVIF